MPSVGGTASRREQDAAFYRSAKNREELIQWLEQRVGPEGRRLFEALVAQVERLEQQTGLSPRRGSTWRSTQWKRVRGRSIVGKGVETTLAARQFRVRTRSCPPCLDPSLGVATTAIEAIARGGVASRLKVVK
jgi:hypothetical protein